MSWSYLFKRFFGFFVSVLAILLIVFFAVRLLPGDPATYILGEMADPRDIENLKIALGLNKSFLAQFLDFASDFLKADLGVSISRNKPVLDLVFTYLGSSFLLSLTSLLLATVFATTVVFLFQYFRSSTPFFLLVTSFFSSVPIFLIAPFGILFFAIRLKLLPVSGSESWAHFVLPSLSLALVLFSPLARLMRSTFHSELKNDYVRTARAKGGSESRVLWVHVLKNSLIPIVVVWAQMWGSVIAGAVVTETLFDWPGLGKLFYGAFQSRDYPLIQGVVICVAIIYSGMQLLVDFLCLRIDKRMEFKS